MQNNTLQWDDNQLTDSNVSTCALQLQDKSQRHYARKRIYDGAERNRDSVGEKKMTTWELKRFLTEIFLIRRRGHVFSQPQ